jgi:hypothetical protein
MAPHPLDAAQPDNRPDDTPVRTYVVRLSDRQVGNLKSLLGRNFAGLTLGVANEFRAIAKAVKQICAEDDKTLDNYD